MKGRFEHGAKRHSPIAAVFLTMALLLVASLLLSYEIGQRVLRLDTIADRDRAVISDLQTALSTLKDAETGQRGYVLTGDEDYLQPYDQALQRIPGKLQTLQADADSGDLPAGDVARLVALSEKKMAELANTVNVRRTAGLDPAAAIVKTGVGRQDMDSIRGLEADLTSTVQNRLTDTNAALANSFHERLIALGGAIAINLFFLAWSYARIWREIQARMAATGDAQRQRDLLAVTLASIGDAVIVTDTDGRITFMNVVATQLTGWRFEDARGTPCAAVFRIINEASRAPVESPVDKVLRDGIIVGLANHTLLITRDGSEIPIDDSGAPVRGTDGAIRGVVLVFRDFRQHKEAEQKLVAANEALQSASRAKDQFLATLSHELRTPLTPVLATLTTWEASEDIPAPLLPDVQMLRRNVELEARLIDDLLDLTRIVKGKMPLHLERVDINHVIDAVTGMYQSEIQGKRIALTAELRAGEHHLIADPARLQQVLWNILKNATKFTPEGGRIALTTTNDDAGHLSITVSDNGIGMTADTLAKLFHPFEQGQDDVTRRFGGLGLGMAISKSLVDAQSGTLTAASAGPGLGSSFTVTFPVVAAPAPGEIVSPPVRPAEKPGRHLRILIVEDHTDTAQVMARLLQGLGHETLISGTVAGAIQMIHEHNFDLLLSDIGLPDGTGIDLIREIRRDFKTPAVALTGFGMEDDIARCTEAGFTAHLTKPVNFQKLAAVIRQITSEAA
jgi:PAS domain S-box-containing protein